jgi:hypothetical protein
MKAVRSATRIRRLKVRLVPSEHDEQVGFVNWFRGHFPGVLIHAIPNGGFRSMALARRLVAEGVVAGIPDLFVPEWRLWIEMKRTRGGVASKAQADMAERLESLGYTVIFGIGAADASRQVLLFCKHYRPC